MDSFVHLRVRSTYSLIEGAVKIDPLIQRCVAESMPAIALTDRNALFGALEFSITACSAGVQPIIGCLLALTTEEPRSPDLILLLCGNEIGYRNLMALSSKAFLESLPGQEPSVKLSTLSEHCEGLMALTGSRDSRLGRLLAAGRMEAAKAALCDLLALFGERNLYIELQRHDLPKEQQIETELVQLADRTGLALIATHDVHFLDADMASAHDVLLCVAQGVTVDTQDRDRLTPHHCFLNAAQMRQRFSDLPEACDNTLTLARRCHFIPKKRPPVLPGFRSEGASSDSSESEDALLCRYAQVGLTSHLEKIDPSDAKIYHELARNQVVSIGRYF